MWEEDVKTWLSLNYFTAPNFQLTWDPRDENIMAIFYSTLMQRYVKQCQFIPVFKGLELTKIVLQNSLLRSDWKGQHNANYRIKLIILINIEIPMIIFRNTEASECSQMTILMQKKRAKESVNLKRFADDYLFKYGRYLTVCCYHVTNTFPSKSTLYSGLNVNELLVQNRLII